MKLLDFLLSAIIILVMTSCDITTYVAVRNYREPVKVYVTYQKAGNPFIDNDTLAFKNIYAPTFDNSLIRQNNSDTSYYFVAPRGKEVALRPTALGAVPIQQIKIVRSTDSVFVVNLNGGRKEFKKLKEEGIMQTKGWIFRHSIIVENK